MSKEITEKRAWILGLSVNCPYSDPDPDCVICQFRGIPFTEAYKLLEELPASELEQVLQYHKNCFAKRGKQRIEG